MSNFTDFFPAGGESSVGSEVASPDSLLRFGYGGLTSVNAIDYWSKIDYWQGATGTTSASNVYTTLLDVTSSGGYLFNVISPGARNTGSPRVVWIKLTVDGVVYEYSMILNSSDLLAFDRFIIGSTYQTDAGAGSVYGSYENDFYSTWQSSSLISPHIFINNNVPRLRFNDSLKVECKQEHYATNNYNHYCGVTYKLD